MRLRFAVALISVVASVAIAACSEGGNGTGSSPPPPPACPATAPAPGTACTALQVCDYPTETGVGAQVAVCPFAGGQWELHIRGDGGVLADAEIPEISVDSAIDGDDAASDATDDAADATDAPAEAEPDALPDTIAADAESDGG
jgi:hypothetical protein